ncbi:MAG: hypothetical protein AAFQ89_01620 [Cyanobacteria bacterium J06626_18]
MLFIAAQIYDWISHQAWITADLSLPWVILGGVGLAIASNRSLLKPISPKTAAGLTSPLPKLQVSEASVQNLPGKPAIATPSTPTQANNTSISFEIPQKAPPQK